MIQFGTTKIDMRKETPDRALFQLTENGREVAISTLRKGGRNGYVLSSVEKKQKGVTVLELGLEKKESRVTPNQTWIITEAR